MTVQIDLDALQASQGIQIPLADGLRVRSSSVTSEAVQGFDGVRGVELVVRVSRLVGQGSPGVTVTVQKSANGSGWSTVHAFSFTTTGEASFTADAPDDYLRVLCAPVGGLREAVVSVTAVPEFVDQASTPGSGTVTEITSDDESLTITNPTGPTVDLSVAAPGGSQPLPLLAQWDYSYESSVQSDGVAIYAVALGRKAAVKVTSPGGAGLDPLTFSDTNTVVWEWPSERRVHGLTCMVLPNDNSTEWLQFNTDAEMILEPDIFLVQQLDQVVAGTGIYGSSALNYPTVLLYDTGDTVVWAVQFWLGSDLDPTAVGVVRTTDVEADTDLHVISIALRGAQTVGLYVDGVFHEWQEADPPNWADQAIASVFDFYWLGTPGNFEIPQPGPGGAYCEARIYDPLTDAEHQSVAAELLAKWTAA